MKIIKNCKIILFSAILIASTIINVNAKQVVDEIAAIVNNDIILESDINNLIQNIKSDNNQKDKKIYKIRLRRNILKHLIMNQVILQVGKKAGINISEKRIDQIITNIARNNNITLEQMRNHLKYDGISYSSYRNQIRKEMIISEIRNREVYDRVVILPQELEMLNRLISSQNNNIINTEFNLSSIVISLLEESTPDKIIEIEKQVSHIKKIMCREKKILNQLVINFFNHKKILKVNHMGWRSIQELPYIFIQALIRAKKGDIVGPIQYGNDFYILKVNDLRINRRNIYITEYHIRHIFLKTSPIMTDYQAFMQLNLIAKDIKNGKISFSEAAKQFSQDYGSSNQGGDLGWISKDIYDSVFSNAMIKLEKRQISAPIHSSLGWHLIEMLDIRQANKTNELQKDLAYHVLFDLKFSEEAEAWMQEKLANAYVRVLSNQ